jgi:PIN like domain
MARKSRKQFATKAESLLSTATFFVDWFGNHVGVELQRAGLTVEFHAAHFAANAADETWLCEVGKRGWIVLTKDKAISKKSVEIQAVITSNVRMFFLPRANMAGAQMASIFLANRHNMGRFIKNHPPPFIARVSASGVVLVFPNEGKA